MTYWWWYRKWGSNEKGVMNALTVALQEPVSKTTARLAPADVEQLRKQRAVVTVPAVPGP